MEVAIKNFKNHFPGKTAVMLGDMFELGAASAKEHVAIAEMVSTLKFDLVLFVGPNFKSTRVLPNAYYFLNSNEAAQWIGEQKLSGFNILIKGSRSSKMEVVLNSIV